MIAFEAQRTSAFFIAAFNAFLLMALRATGHGPHRDVYLVMIMVSLCEDKRVLSEILMSHLNEFPGRL